MQHQSYNLSQPSRGHRNNLISFSINSLHPTAARHDETRNQARKLALPPGRVRRGEREISIPSSPSLSSSSGSHWAIRSKKEKEKEMEMAAMDPYIVGTFFVSILGVVLLYVLRRSNGDVRAKVPIPRKDGDYVTTCDASPRDSVNRDCSPENGFGAADVVIIGAGVAGSALAHTLGKQSVELQFVSSCDCVEEIDAQRVLGYAMFIDGRNTRLLYPLGKFHSDVAGWSFHNGRFIQRMREKAATLPNVRLEQGTVTSLIEDNGTIKGVHYKTKAGQELEAFAPLTIVCDGCFSNLRHSLCKPQVDVPSHFVGLVLENCELPFANHGYVILADPSPILFYQISSTEVRCLVDVPGQKLPSIANGEMAKYLKSVVAPQIPSQVHDAFVAAIDKGNIRTMPNRSMPADPYPTPGALLLGDACNMRHPLTGGGMTVALSDIVVLRDLLKPLRNLHDAAALCRYLESFHTLRKPVASTINTLAGAPYKGASSIIFPIIRAEGVRQMFFPRTVPSFYRAPSDN